VLRILPLNPAPESSAGRTPADASDAPRSDHDLVQHTLRGDERAVEDFITRMRCVPRVLSALNAKYGSRLDEHDLADLAQDTVLLLWQKRATFTDFVKLETWAYGVARFEFMNALRRKTRSRIAPQDVHVDGFGEPLSRPISDGLEYGELLASLDRLDPSEAAVVRLKHFEELTFEAIGAVLSITANTAKTRYYRAIRALQENLRSRLGSRDASP